MTASAPPALAMPQNEIPEKQNEPRMLEMLQAKSALYDQAQTWYTAQFAVAVVGSLILSVVTVVLPQGTAVVAMGGVVIAAIEHYLLDPQQSRLRTLAAQVQELFDCELFSLPHRADRVDAETIARWAAKHPSTARLRNWYAAEVGALPLPFARVVCQRSSAYWSAGMRRRFGSYLRAAALGLSAIIAVVAMATGQSLLASLSWLAIALPLIGWLLRESRRQAESADASDAAVKLGQKLWDRLVMGSESTEADVTAETRELQNNLYDQRRRDPQVFGWVYHRYRDEDGRTMQIGVAGLLDDLRRRRPSVFVMQADR